MNVELFSELCPTELITLNNQGLIIIIYCFRYIYEDAVLHCYRFFLGLHHLVPEIISFPRNVRWSEFLVPYYLIFVWPVDRMILAYIR